MSDPIEIFLVVVAIAYVLIRRTAGQPAQGRSLLVLPTALILIGLTNLSQAWSPVSIEVMVGTTLVSLVIGLLRGVSIGVFDRDGIAFMRYTWLTVVLWVVNICIKLGAGAALGILDKSAESSVSSGLLLSVGAGLLMEGCVVLFKAVNTRSRVIWAQGKNGSAHATSPFLDSLQRDRTAGIFNSGCTRDEEN